MTDTHRNYRKPAMDQIQAIVLAGRNYGARVISYLDGPLSGQFEEVESGWPCPNSVEQTIDGRIVKYEVDTKTGHARLDEVTDVLECSHDH